MAQSVKCQTVDLGSGCDLTVCVVEPQIGLHADSEEPAWDSLSLSVKINKLKKKRSKKSHSSQPSAIKKKRFRMIE